MLKKVLKTVCEQDIEQTEISVIRNTYSKENAEKYNDILLFFVKAHYRAGQYVTALRYLVKAQIKEERSLELYLLTISLAIYLFIFFFRILHL